MRNQLLKLTKGHSTKSERIFVEILKKLKIPFTAKAKIGKHEVDFLVVYQDVKYTIEINGHEQNTEKNKYMLEHSYVPVHYNNYSVLNSRNKVEEDIKKLLNIKQ